MPWIGSKQRFEPKWVSTVINVKGNLDVIEGEKVQYKTKFLSDHLYASYSLCPLKTCISPFCNAHLVSMY